MQHEEVARRDGGDKKTAYLSLTRFAFRNPNGILCHSETK